MLQMHFGADYASGAYRRVYGLDEVKTSIRWQMEKVRTEYIDYGFIHCIEGFDSLSDEWNGEMVDHILKLRGDGTMRHIGLSTNTPKIVMKVFDSEIVDIVMFSINLTYYYRRSEFAFGDVDKKTALYRKYQAEGVGISIIKAWRGAADKRRNLPILEGLDGGPVHPVHPGQGQGGDRGA